MKWLTLERVKKHLRLDASNTQEDDLLQLYATAAEDTILNLCNRSYDCLLECYGEVPKPIQNASLLLVENQYTPRPLLRALCRWLVAAERHGESVGLVAKAQGALGTR